MPHHNSTIPIVSERARYLPPRNPIDSELGLVDATTLLLLQKMMADAHEHGRVVWKENKARCALTGEPESDALPCGPNSSQKKVEAWLVHAGLLDADSDAESDEESADESTPPDSPVMPETPRRRPWHRRLEIVIPSKAAPKSASEPALQPPRSPLSPVKLWSAVQRGTAAIPTVRLKPKHLPPPAPAPSAATPQRKKCCSLDSAAARPARPEAADPADSVLTTAFKRAALLRTITDDDVDAIMRRHRGPLPDSLPSDASWHVPAHAPLPSLTPTRIPASPRPKPRPAFEDPALYRWPAPAPPPPPPPLLPAEAPARGALACPDVRWYHPLLLFLLWHVLLVSFSAYVVLRLVLKPLLVLLALYYAVFFVGVLFSLFSLM
ncbi:hypothetical protein FB451DRAFT_1197851 [Mycena latifolia]|nr:hypothetical protein FB451DRAFT_1197851 [Mycena latifolia]